MAVTRIALLSALLLACFASLTRAKIITLPAGFRAEGVTHARGTNFFASDVNSDSVLLVDAASGLLTTAVPDSNAVPVRQGLGMNAAAGLLFVAGGFLDATFRPANRSDTIRVYDVVSGALRASCTHPEAGLVNDVVADTSHAYFTDSFRPFVYRLAVATLPGCEIAEIPLSHPAFTAPGVRSNGIEMYAGGLLVANMLLGSLFFVDLQRGNRVVRVSDDGVMPGVDGLQVTYDGSGARLYTAMNVLSVVRVWKLSFDARARRPSVSFIREIKEPGYNGTATVAVGGGYVVTAELALQGGLDDPGPFNLTAVKL